MDKIDSNLYKCFNEKKFTPNDSQLKAILSTENPLFLTAGPGSGKTRVILWRTLNLIAFYNVRPDEIFLTTFTQRAALQLKEGLQGLLSIASKYTKKPYDISEMYIGTLHSLCQKLLTDRRFNINSARSRRPILMDELDQYFFVADNIEDLLQHAGFEKDSKHTWTETYKEINSWFGIKIGASSKIKCVQNCISFFNRMCEEDYSDKDIDFFISSTVDEMENSLFKMTKYYRELLKNGRSERVDFSILQQHTFHHITKDINTGSVFKYVIVDEYQDTNSIQEKIYFALSAGTKNICVVGDDDQALYRFRGATVESLVNFEDKCEKKFEIRPLRIDLNINYRSKKQIVDTYSSFIEKCDWQNKSNKSKYYRIQNKNIISFNEEKNDSVIFESGEKDDIARKIADFIKNLKQAGTIQDYNQCAILFPSLMANGEKNAIVKSYAKALEDANIPYYSPRANGILEQEEFKVVFGLFYKILNVSADESAEDNKKPQAEYKSSFDDWLASIDALASDIVDKDVNLEKFIISKRTEIEIYKKNFKILQKFCDNRKLDMQTSANPQILRLLSTAQGISEGVKKLLLGKSLNEFILRKSSDGNSLSIKYVLSRVTAFDWTLLDLFYQLNTFKWFIPKYESAETGKDDSAIFNFGLITKYISKYMGLHNQILTGASFVRNQLYKNLFTSFLQTIYQFGETEMEDAEDPFPKGCVPFLTIHQSKGLEFPVVILAGINYRNRDARPLNVLVYRLKKIKNDDIFDIEPLDKMNEFDEMRKYYVALSRAKNLLVIAESKGQGLPRAFGSFFQLASEFKYKDCDSINLAQISPAATDSDRMAHIYTYTGDYLPYKNCPRNYMVFHKYGFVPSRSQTMFFGSLVHKSIEDLHNFINEAAK